MTVEELKEKKFMCEAEIDDILTRFVMETGVDITGANVWAHTNGGIGGGPSCVTMCCLSLDI